jgi:hypothetical protein
MTYEPSTADLGGALLKWCLAAFRVRTFQQQEKEQESPEPGRDSGSKWRESSVKYDPSTHGWKTLQCLWEEVLESSSLTLQRWGSMRNGELSERTMPALLTSESASGSWPTIRSTDGEKGGRGDLIQAVRGNENSHYKLNVPTPRGPKYGQDMAKFKREPGRKRPSDLETFVHMYPTVTVNGNYNHKGASAKSGDGLATAVTKMLPTPNTVDAKGGTRNGEGQVQLCHVAGGALNPPWVEWLMGWPIGWTELSALGTGRFREWFGLHGEPLSNLAVQDKSE